MGFSSSKSKSYVQNITRDERMAASSGGVVIRGSGNVLMSGGDYVSQSAVEEMGASSREIAQAAESLGLHGLNTAKDLSEIIAQLVESQAQAELEAKELDTRLLNLALTSQRNLADAAVQNATRLAETKMAGGINPQVLMQQVLTGVLVAAIVTMLFKR